MARLVQRMANGSLGKEWQLSDQPLRAGRGDKVDVMIADSEMSREHFAIIPQGKAHLIKDLNSKNGTRINGRHITEHTLQPNDQITAGRTTFVYVTDKPKGLRTVIGEIEKESKETGKGYSTMRRELYKKA